MNTVFHVGLTVSDLERSCRFYAGLVGFRVESDLQLPGERIAELLQLEPHSTLHAIYLSLGGFTLELMQFDPPSEATAASRRFDQTGLAHLSLAVDDPEAIVARARFWRHFRQQRIRRICNPRSGRPADRAAAQRRDRSDPGRAAVAGLSAPA
jgi:catechol 2,3-dioxygenase-like lactoylglutathione lyase family enzyme